MNRGLGLTLLPAPAKEPVVRLLPRNIIPTRHIFLALPLHFAAVYDAPYLRAKRLLRTFPPMSSRVHTSGLLLTPSRAMRYEPGLCGSMIASSRPKWCFTHPSSSAGLAVAYSPPALRLAGRSPILSPFEGPVPSTPGMATRTCRTKAVSTRCAVE